MQPTTLSKANTGGQLALLLALLSHGAWDMPPTVWIGGLTYLVAATTFSSGVDYTIKFVQLLRGNDSGSVMKIKAKKADAESGGGGGGG